MEGMQTETARQTGKNIDPSDFSHTPVLLNECIGLLNIKPDGFYVDGTVGGAGHASEILRHLGEGGMLLGIDRDEEALRAACERLSGVDTKARFELKHGTFSGIREFCEGRRPDGILLDLGVSSHQLDEPERGFSYRFDSPLDMRMDQSSGKSAYDVVNGYSQAELTAILRIYGEERYAAKIAAAIVRARTHEAVRTTMQLSDIVRSAVPGSYLKGEGHPAKRTFQAIRIEVNDELEELRKVLDSAIGILNGGGRLVIITFHSLEDRIVKNKFKEAQDPCTCPPYFPVCVCGKKPLGRVITPHPVTGSEAEIAKNNRAHSAKVRAFERTGEAE